MTKNDLGGVPLVFLWGRPAGTDDHHYALASPLQMRDRMGH